MEQKTLWIFWTPLFLILCTIAACAEFVVGCLETVKSRKRCLYAGSQKLRHTSCFFWEGLFCICILEGWQQSSPLVWGKLSGHCNFQIKLVQCLLTSLPLEIIRRLVQNAFSSVRTWCCSNSCYSRRPQTWFLIDLIFHRFWICVMEKQTFSKISIFSKCNLLTPILWKP